MTCKIGLWEWVERKGRRRWEENEEGDGKKMIGWRGSVKMCVVVGMGGLWAKN